MSSRLRRLPTAKDSNIRYIGASSTFFFPARHDHLVFEVACQRERVLASGGVAGQVNAFVITQNCLPSVRWK